MDGDGRMLVLLVPLILEHIRCSKTSWRSFSKSIYWGADSICYLYQVVLDSDAGLFGGFGRIHHEAEHFTTVSFVAHDIAFGTQMSTCSWQKMWANFCYNIGHYLQTVHMITGPIPSRFIHQAEPASSMLQRNDSKVLVAGRHVWGCRCEGKKTFCQHRQMHAWHNKVLKLQSMLESPDILLRCHL